MDFQKTVILQVVVLAVILESDLGLKKISFFRIIRPVIAAVAVGAIYLTTLPTGDHDVILMGIGAAVGIVLGLISVSPLLVAVGFDPKFRGRRLLGLNRDDAARPAAVSRCGGGYALLWIAAAAARLAFSYGSQHWFPHALATFLAKHQLSQDALTDALIFFTLGMDLFRSAGLLSRGWLATRTRLAIGAPADGGRPVRAR